MGNLKNKAKDTHQKALEINLDRDKYGTLAEIGGGQEVDKRTKVIGAGDPNKARRGPQG